MKSHINRIQEKVSHYENLIEEKKAIAGYWGSYEWAHHHARASALRQLLKHYEAVNKGVERERFVADWNKAIATCEEITVPGYTV